MGWRGGEYTIKRYLPAPIVMRGSAHPTTRGTGGKRLARHLHAPSVSPHAECHHRFNGIGKAVTPDRLRQKWRSGYLFADALDRVGVSVSGDEDDTCLARLSKLLSNFDPFVPSGQYQADCSWLAQRLLVHLPPDGKSRSLVRACVLLGRGRTGVHLQLSMRGFDVEAKIGSWLTTPFGSAPVTLTPEAEFLIPQDDGGQSGPLVRIVYRLCDWVEGCPVPLEEWEWKTFPMESQCA